MAGVTTAIVSFIFVCVVFPHLVKHRPQFYAALGAVVLILLLDSIAQMVYRPPTTADAGSGGGFHAFAYAVTALLQIAAILGLFFSCGGVSPRDVAGEMRRAIEVIRRGEDEKEIIIPLTGQQPPPRTPAAPPPAPATPATPVPPSVTLKPDDRSGSLPIE